MTIGVYDTHEKAAHAIDVLKEAGYPIKHLSLMGNASLVSNDLHQVDKHSMLVNAPLITGVVAGPILGALAGIGMFAIPGFGILVGAGAVVGAFAGLNVGMIGGGVATVLAELGVKEEKADVYEAQLKEGKFLAMVEGTEEQVLRAQKILHEHDTHHELEAH